jgi:hypothetical protein
MRLQLSHVAAVRQNAGDLGSTPALWRDAATKWQRIRYRLSLSMIPRGFATGERDHAIEISSGGIVADSVTVKSRWCFYSMSGLLVPVKSLTYSANLLISPEDANLEAAKEPKP